MTECVLKFKFKETVSETRDLSVVDLGRAEIVESGAVHRDLVFPALEHGPQARLTPLFEQPDSTVRGVLGDLSDSQLARYREVCRSLAFPAGKTCKRPESLSTEIRRDGLQT